MLCCSRRWRRALSRRICWNARRCLPRIPGSHYSRLHGRLRIAPHVEPRHRILPLRRPRRSRHRFERRSRRHSPIPLGNFAKLRRAIFLRPCSSQVNRLFISSDVMTPRSETRSSLWVCRPTSKVRGKVTWEWARGKSANERLASVTHRHPGDSRRDWSRSLVLPANGGRGRP